MTAQCLALAPALVVVVAMMIVVFVVVAAAVAAAVGVDAGPSSTNLRPGLVLPPLLHPLALRRSPDDLAHAPASLKSPKTRKAPLYSVLPPSRPCYWVCSCPLPPPPPRLSP